MSNQARGLARLGIVHAPGGAVDLSGIGRAAAGLCRPVIIFRESVAAAQPQVVAIAQRLFETHTVADESLPQLGAELGLSGVTTFHDAELEHADAAARACGTHGPATITAPWDKLVQRRRLADAGLTMVRAIGVDSTRQLRAAVADIGLPGVLKPRRGNSGTGLAMIDTGTDVDYQNRHRREWNGLLYESRIPDGQHPSRPWLADFVSVETVNTEAHHHIAVVDKLKLSLVRRGGADAADSLAETGDLVPSRLPATMVDHVLDYTSRCLDVLGVRWRVTHTEVKLTPSGPELLEVNGRTAGFLGKLIRLAGGPDLTRAAMSLALGQRPAVAAGPLPGHALLLLPTFRHRSGAVRSAVSAAVLRSLPGVSSVDEVAARGSQRSDTSFRMATINLVAGSAAEIDAHRIAITAALDALFASDDVP